MAELAVVREAAWPWLTALGVVVGALFGLFGVGGSSVATPALAVLGVRGIVAVASPLPATFPAALAGAWAYLRRGEVDREIAGWSVAGGAPAAVVGALLSRVVGGKAVLVASGVVLAIAGARVLRHPSDPEAHADARRRRRPALVASSTALVGLATGLLANGGGFLLVPLYLVVFGLSMRPASGTSLVVISVLALPTVITHWALGHIDWGVTGAFAVGLVPGAVVGSRYAERFEGPTLRRSFGWLLVAFAVYFVVRQLAG